MTTRYVARDLNGRLNVRVDGCIAYAPHNTRVDDYQKVWVNHPPGDTVSVRLEPRGKYVELWEIDNSSWDIEE